MPYTKLLKGYNIEQHIDGDSHFYITTTLAASTALFREEDFGSPNLKVIYPTIPTTKGEIESYVYGISQVIPEDCR